jgi:hypothetical protein
MRVHFHRTGVHCPESRDSDWLGPTRLPSAHLAPTRLSMDLAWGNQRPLAYARARPLLTLQSPKGAAKGAFTMTPPDSRSFKLCVDNHKYIQLVSLEDRDVVCCGLIKYSLRFFSCRWIVQFCTIQRQLKRNGGSTFALPPPVSLLQLQTGV